MFGRGKRTGHRALSDARLLRMEPLESRDLLSGTVNILTGAALPPPPPLPALPAGAFPLPVAGDLYLAELATDPNQPNQIDIRSTGVANEYEITGRDGTQLQYNGSVLAPDTPLVVSLITGSIYVDLGALGDKTRFLPQSATASSTVLNDLFISTDGGDTVEIGDFSASGTSGVIVQGELVIGGTVAGLTTLRIKNTRVDGPTVIRSAPGSTSTTIIDSRFLGSAVGPPSVALLAGEGAAFAMTNAGGADTVNIHGLTTFGTPSTPPGLALSLANGVGGAMVTFSPETPSDPDRIKVYGDVAITNGNNGVGIAEIVRLEKIDVTGGVFVDNDNAGGAGVSPGGSRVIIIDSNLGTDLFPAGPGAGNPLVVFNGNGPDSFSMTNSEVPWGTFVNHANATVTDGATNTTTITGGKIGTRAGGPSNPLPATLLPPAVIGVFAAAGYAAGDALLVQGDQGNDSMKITGTQIGGSVRVELHNGDNDLTIESKQSSDPALDVPALFYNVALNAPPPPPGAQNANGNNTDHVTLRDVAISVALQMFFGGGDDILELRGKTVLPTFGGPIISGGSETNTLKKDAGILPDPLLGLIDIWLPGA